MAERTTGDPIQRQHGKADTTKSLHTAANGSKHTPHLSLASLVDDRLDDSTFSLSVQNAQPCRSRSSVVQKNPIPKCSKSILSDVSRDLCTIYLVNLKTRMEQSLCHRTIVGNDQKPLRIGIQSPHGVEPRREIRQKIEHGLTPPIIVRRRKIAARLVEKKIKPLFFCLYTLTVDGYDMMCGIIFRSECGHNRAINRNPPRLNHLLSSTARCHPRMAEDLLQSFFHVSPYRIFTALSPISCVSSRRTAAEPSIQWCSSSCRHRPSL